MAPACNDSGPVSPDGVTQVQPLHGLPATVAVTSPGGEGLFVAGGSLTGLAAHPLHRATAARVRLRRPAGCRPSVSTIHGALQQDASFNAITLRRRNGTTSLFLDERTRLLRRPVWTPLLAGQRVRVTASTCHRTTLARTIQTVGPLVGPRLVAARGGSASSGPWLTGGRRTAAIVLLAALALAGIGAAGWHAGRTAASR